jgi:hypothetical protein
LYQTIDQFRIDPDTKPCGFRLPEIVLLVPAASRPNEDDAIIDGSLDGADENRIFGWAFDKKHPERTLQVDLYDGDRLLATVPADQFREDLPEAKIGDGKHAFSFPTPERLRDGTAHTIRARARGTGVELPASPKILGPQPLNPNP